MKVLILGAGGQLGRELCKAVPKHVDLVATHSGEVNIVDAAQLAKKIADENPAVVINAAAYTQVDKAEAESAQAWAVNNIGVRNLIATTAATTRLIHISTDFVFDGAATLPYLPAAPVSPLSVYGCSKQAGEQELLKNAANRSCIVRTAWLYSALGKNFVNTMLALMASKDEIKVVDDQRGTPTSVASLAAVVWRLVERPDLRGVYHWTDGGETSWYGFACEIQRLGLQYGLLQRVIPMLPIATAQYPTAARRPSYSVLDITATCEALQISPAAWQLELAKVLKNR